MRQKLLVAVARIPPWYRALRSYMRDLSLGYAIGAVGAFRALRRFEDVVGVDPIAVAHERAARGRELAYVVAEVGRVQ